MIRGKIVDARKARYLTQTQLGSRVGVTKRTVQRWEHGEMDISLEHRQALCVVLELDDADLDVFGLERGAAMPLVAHEETSPLYNGLDSQLITTVMQWPRSNTHYTLLQETIRTLMEQSMDTSRRKAMKLLGSLPISAFGLSKGTASLIRPEEALPWMASGLVAAFGLGRSTDLAIADSIAMIYLPTLEALTSHAQYRQSAAILASQAYSLRTTMGWHLGTNAIAHAQNAEKYSAMTNDAMLIVDALYKSAIANSFEADARSAEEAPFFHEVALQKAEEARYFMEHHPVPSPMKCRVYLGLACFQGYCGKLTDAKQSLKLSHKLRSSFQNQGEAPYLLDARYVSEAGLLSIEGQALAARGEHDIALDLYQQAQRVGDRSKSERGYVELLTCRLRSLLAQSSPDKKECIKLWADAISSGQAMESERFFREALALLDTMEKLWPREDDVVELREVATHW